MFFLADLPQRAQRLYILYFFLRLSSLFPFNYPPFTGAASGLGTPLAEKTVGTIMLFLSRIRPCHNILIRLKSLSVIRSRGDIAAPACPVGMEKLSARFIGPLIGVRPEIITLSLQQIGR